MRSHGLCVSEGIEHYVTESDGTPATGKNSVLRLFLESDNEYMVHVDGDDMITPYGRNLYRTANTHRRTRRYLFTKRVGDTELSS